MLGKPLLIAFTAFLLSAKLIKADQSEDNSNYGGIAAKDVLKEAVRQKLEDQRYFDRVTMEEAKRRMAATSENEYKELDSNSIRQSSMLDDIMKVKEVVRTYFGSVKSEQWLRVKVSKVLQTSKSKIPDFIIQKIIELIFGNLDDTIKDLIDYLETALEDVVDYLMAEAGDEIEELIKMIEDDLIGALEYVRDSDFGGLPVMFDEETREAIYDIRDDMDIMVIIMSIICTIFSLASILHGVEKLAEVALSKKRRDDKIAAEKA